VKNCWAIEALVHLGVHLFDNCDLEALAAAAKLKVPG
jgi:hypothetical protein